MIRYPTMHVNFLDHRLGKSADAEPVKGEPMPARGIGYGVTEPGFSPRTQRYAISKGGEERLWLILAFALSLAVAAGIFYSV